MLVSQELKNLEQVKKDIEHIKVGLQAISATFIDLFQKYLNLADELKKEWAELYMKNITQIAGIDFIKFYQTKQMNSIGDITITKYSSDGTIRRWKTQDAISQSK